MDNTWDPNKSLRESLAKSPLAAAATDRREMRNEHQQFHTTTWVQPNYISPGELRSLLEHIANMYPMQFIVEFLHSYDPKLNETAVRIVTTGERFPNQFAKPEPVVRPYNLRDHG